MNINKIFHSDDKRTASVKKNILGSLVIRGVSILVSLLIVPMTLNYVSSEVYGIWLTLSSVMLWLNFFDVGFTLGLKNKLAEAIALDNWDKGRKFVSTTYFMMFVIFIPLCFLLETLIPFFKWNSFLNVSAIYESDIQRTLIILVACFCFQMIFNVLTSVVAAFQKVALSSAFPVIGNFISLIIVFILTKTCEPSLLVLALAISLPPIVVALVASFILFSTKFKKVKPSIKCIDIKEVRSLFSLGAKFFLIQIQVVLLFQTTNILITNMSSPVDVTNYNIAYKYLSIAMMVYSIMLGPLWPAFTDAYTKKDFSWMNNVYSKMKKVYAASVVILVIMMICSSLIYPLWLGDNILIPLEMTLCVGLYIIVNIWDSLQAQLINGIGCVRLQTYVTILGILIYIPLSFLLGKYVGAIGVVIAQIIITLIYSICFTIQLRKLLSNKASGIWIK